MDSDYYRAHRGPLPTAGFGFASITTITTTTTECLPLGRLSVCGISGGRG
jgi:hypothetical protein